MSFDRVQLNPTHLFPRGTRLYSKIDFSVWSKEIRPSHTQNNSVAFCLLNCRCLCSIGHKCSDVLKLHHDFSLINVADKVVILYCPELVLNIKQLSKEYQNRRYSPLLKIVVWILNWVHPPVLLLCCSIRLSVIIVWCLSPCLVSPAKISESFY